MKRSRGRGRRPQNSHNRAFDSTGPDIKIRGTAAHVYEKYLQLARDAGSQGDRVTAENYLQHAEHYYRILMAQGGLQQQQNGQPNPNYNGGQGGQPQPQQNGEMHPPQEGYNQAPGNGPSFNMNDAGDEGDEGDEAA